MGSVFKDVFDLQERPLRAASCSEQHLHESVATTVFASELRCPAVVDDHVWRVDSEHRHDVPGRPGHSAVTVTPEPRSSSAMPSEKLSTNALVA